MAKTRNPYRFHKKDIVVIKSNLYGHGFKNGQKVHVRQPVQDGLWAIATAKPNSKIDLKTNGAWVIYVAEVNRYTKPSKNKKNKSFKKSTI